jgi:hypothetical protein
MEHHVCHCALVDVFKVLQRHDELLVIKADEVSKVQ